MAGVGGLSVLQMVASGGRSGTVDDDLGPTLEVPRHPTSVHKWPMCTCADDGGANAKRTCKTFAKHD